MFGPGTLIMSVSAFLELKEKQCHNAPLSPFAMIIGLGTTNLFLDIRLIFILSKINSVPMSHGE